MYLLLIPFILGLLFSLLDSHADAEVERYREHCELMDELEMQGLEASERHDEDMRQRRELMERERGRKRRRERRIVGRPDGSWAAPEITEEEE